MKKLFISQPMKGLTSEDIEAERDNAIKDAIEIYGEELSVIDSFIKNVPATAKPLWFLGKSIELLSTADVAYFCKGWETARGCVIEHECAVSYGIDTIIANPFND